MPLQVTGWQSEVINTGIVTLNGSPDSMVAANQNRRAIHISNASTHGMYVGKNDSVSNTNGFFLPASATISLLFYRGPLWVTGTNADVCTYIEESE